jgi:lauroyl/myristoyl acyltransferase
MFHLTRVLMRLAPPSILEGFFNALGSLAFYSVPGVGQRLERKISDSLPEVTDPRRINLIGRRACSSLLLPIFDILFFRRYGDRFMRELRVEGFDNLLTADAAGRGVILLGAHNGINALRISAMSRIGKPYTPIYLHPSSSPVPRYYMTMCSFGVTLGCDRDEPVFWTGENTKNKVREHLCKGKRVGIDFDVPGKCVVDFFGRPGALADGIAHFAIETGAAIVPFMLVRGENAFDNRLVFYEPIVCELSGELNGDVQYIMQKVAMAGEEMIREAPEQWESWFGIRYFWELAEELEPQTNAW